MTAHTNDPQTNMPTPNKGGSKNIVVIVVLGIVVAAMAVKMYLDHQESTKTKVALTNSEEELASSLQQLTDIQEELNQKIVEIEELGGDVAELEAAKAEIEAELSRTKKRDQRAISALKDKVNGFQELLKLKDEQIEKLKEVNEELVSENTTLKTEKNELNSTIQEINETKEALESKVALASQLKAENFQILAVNTKGRERDMPARSKHIDKLKITFNLAENSVAPIEGKNVLIRILDSNGQVIFDVAKGSGTFMFNNKEEFYTANQEVLFDNSQQQLTFEYAKGSKYDPGKYLLEVYTDDYKMGSYPFEVR